MATRGPSGRKVPTSVQNHLGDGRLEKGNWHVGSEEDEKFYLLAWDFAKECSGDKCPIHHLCEYKNQWQMRTENQGKPGSTSKCLLHQRYLKNVMHAVVEKLQNTKDFSQEGVIKLGYQLLPLYDQLFKFKMWEYGNHELVYLSEKGTPKVHPVYKEIRDIIKTISGLWKDIGGVDKKNGPPDGTGDENFIDAMSSGTSDAQHSTEEGTGMDFSESEVEEKPKKRKQSGTKKKKRGGDRKNRKTKNDVPGYRSKNRKTVNDEKDDE